MKRLRLQKTNLTVLLILLGFISCKNTPSDEEIKSMLAMYEKEGTSTTSPLLVSFCIGNKQIKIPKTFNFVTLQSQTPAEDPSQKELDVLNALASDNFISMTKTSDQTDIVQDYGVRVRRKYTIELTEQGNAAKAGETGDDFILNLLDYNKLDIVNKEEITSDTLKVTYAIGHKQVLASLKKFCLDGTANRIENYQPSLKLYKAGKEWKILKK